MVKASISEMVGLHYTNAASIYQLCLGRPVLKGKLIHLQILKFLFEHLFGTIPFDSLSWALNFCNEGGSTENKNSTYIKFYQMKVSENDQTQG